MQDQPRAETLLEAVGEYLDREVIPHTEGRRQFLGRVSSNVVRMVKRELRLRDRHLRAEWRRLDELQGSEPMPEDEEELREQLRRRTRDLCRSIRRGDADEDPRRSAVFEHVRATVREKLEVCRPDLLQENG